MIRKNKLGPAQYFGKPVDRSEEFPVARTEHIQYEGCKSGEVQPMDEIFKLAGTIIFTTPDGGEIKLTIPKKEPITVDKTAFRHIYEAFVEQHVNAGTSANVSNLNDPHALL